VEMGALGQGPPLEKVAEVKKLIDLFDSYEKAEADCKEADRYRDEVLGKIQELFSNAQAHWFLWRST